jgi:predicted O-methyltransferase YrrM
VTSVLKLKSRVRNFLLHTLVPPPIKPAHWEYSGISNLGDDEFPSKELVSMALRAIERAQSVDLSDLVERIPNGFRYTNSWPGEHYRLLAGLVSTLSPKLVVEIGTYSGLSALALLRFLPATSKLVTYDIVRWDQIPGTVLRQEDFRPGRFEQRITDLSRPDVARADAELLKQADFIFVDAAKDGRMEWRLLDNFRGIGLKKGAVMVFDDIRVWNMLAVWKSIQYSKMDLTSFGHYTGTGLVLVD